MNPNLQQIFLDTIDVDAKKRISAEKQLEALRTEPKFILSLPQTYMASSNPIVAKVSSIYYKNSVISEYNKSLCGNKKQIIDSIMNYMLQDHRNFNTHKEVLGHIFSVEHFNDIQGIIESMVVFSESNDENAFRAAITAMKILIEKDKIKYRSGETLDAVFEKMGPIILKKFKIYFEHKKYEFVKMIMIVFTLAHEGFYIPKFITNIDVFSIIIEMTMNILRDLTDDIENWQARQYASSFICKATNRSIKSYYKNKMMAAHLLENSRFSEIYEIMKLIFNSKKDTKETIYNAVEFVLLLASEEKYFHLILNDIFFLIFEVILPSHAFTNEEQIEFVEQPDAYLKSKYNYYANDIRCSAGALFAEIINRVTDKPNIFSEIYNSLFKIFIEHEQHLTATSAVQKYAALFLIVNITDSIIKLKKDTLKVLITNVIYKDLDSPYPFLQSQCLYSLQFFEGKMFENEYTAIALDRVLSFLNGDSEVLKVDAVLTIPYFMNCQSVHQTIKQNIQIVIQTLILMSNKYGLESLTDTLELIISSYPNEISYFAPQLTETLSNTVITQLQNADDRLATISGFLRTISDLVLSLPNQKQILYEMYLKSYPSICYIFKNQCADFYIEAIDLVSNFIYGFKQIDNTMWDLFQIILRIDKNEIINVSEEISCLIDNFVTFGSQLLTTNHLDKIYQIIEYLCIQEEDYLFDDDFICGCRIIETILLNMGYVAKDPQRIEFFISMINSNYEHIDTEISTIVFGLEVIMNCIIINREESLKILMKLNLMNAITDIYKFKSKFTRVHDKKILILYVCEMMKINKEQAQSLYKLNYKQLNEVLVFAIKTLPSAIENREKLKRQENEEASSIQNDSIEDYDDYQETDDLEEDLSFETPLDNFNVYGYCKEMFTNIQNESVGYEMVMIMSDTDKQELAKLLS
ncbi:putative importin [Dictyocoela muelleri]|nr:putative importin [Dictyocoela muelleri]